MSRIQEVELRGMFYIIPSNIINDYESNSIIISMWLPCCFQTPRLLIFSFLRPDLAIGVLVDQFLFFLELFPARGGKHESSP